MPSDVSWAAMATGMSSALVARPRLWESLDGGVAFPVTVVTGSAGAGKTVMVLSWLERRRNDFPAAFVAVQRGERDAQRFWGAVIDAVGAAVAGRLVIEPLEPTPTFDADTMVNRLLVALEGLESRLVLVIDDLHELAAPAVRDQFGFFLERLPSSVHVVLISRRHPQLGLHRRRVAGQLSEIRGAELRLSVEEARELLAASAVSLSEESLLRLHGRTEGWAAGLRLAAMSLASGPDPDAFVAEFSGSERTVAEYLLAEVLDAQSERVRRLLVRASLLERVNGALGDLLTGDSGSEREFQILADEGDFVLALDASRRWFRFHHLFADLLSAELRNSEPDEIPRLHALAAGWFAEHGFVLEAISHAQATGEHGAAAGMLIEHYFSLVLDGHRDSARALLERLDTAATAASPEAAVVLAAEELLEGSLDRAAEHLGLAERGAVEVPPHRRDRFQMALLVTRLSLARRRGDVSSVLEDVSPLVGISPVLSDAAVSVSSDLRTLAWTNLGIAEVWAGKFEEGVQHLEEACELARQNGRVYVEVECQTHLAQATFWRSFSRGRDACREVISLAEAHGWGADPVIGPALVTLATSLMQAGRFAEAEVWLTRAEETLRRSAAPAVGVQLHLVRGGLCLARGEYQAAMEHHRRAERLGAVLVEDSPLARQLRSSFLRAMLGAGQATEVRSALARMSDSEQESGEIREVIAQLALSEGDAQAALATLAPTLSGVAEAHHEVVLVRSFILEALARDLLSERAAVQAAVERALDLAEPEMLILPFLHLPCRELLERHPRHRTAHAALIALILDVLAGQAPPAEPVSPSLDVEPLSEAELRVLRYLPTNLSAAAIAGELYASVHTVRTHMRHIYAKLAVHTRAEAVSRARELGLLAR